MRVHWIYAHPSTESLNARLYRAGTAHLRQSGHDVVTSDLYAMDWNPVFSQNDFGEYGRDHATVIESSPA